MVALTPAAPPEVLDWLPSGTLVPPPAGPAGGIFADPQAAHMPARPKARALNCFIACFQFAVDGLPSGISSPTRFLPIIGRLRKDVDSTDPCETPHSRGTA
jgi:hypothetical protein